MDTTANELVYKLRDVYFNGWQTDACHGSALIIVRKTFLCDSPYARIFQREAATALWRHCRQTNNLVMLNFSVLNYFRHFPSSWHFFFMSAFVLHSIIPHQHMQKLCILMQNCDFESTLKSRLRSRNRPIIGGYRPSRGNRPIIAHRYRLHFCHFFAFKVL